MQLKHYAKLIITTAVVIVVINFLVKQFAPANVQNFFRV